MAGVVKPGKQRAGKLAWPKTLSERVKAISTTLATVKEPVTAPELAKRFARARAAEVGENAFTSWWLRALHSKPGIRPSESVCICVHLWFASA
jgi:hypothetical protein